MAKVGIVMGSDSDMPIMKKAADVLEQLGVEFEMTIISAHREPDTSTDFLIFANKTEKCRMTKTRNPWQRTAGRFQRFRWSMSISDTGRKRFCRISVFG